VFLLKLCADNVDTLTDAVSIPFDFRHIALFNMLNKALLYGLINNNMETLLSVECKLAISIKTVLEILATINKDKIEYILAYKCYGVDRILRE
jgi:hypothetical protein